MAETKNVKSKWEYLQIEKFDSRTKIEEPQ